jgi:anti-anti-sigma factor
MNVELRVRVCDGHVVVALIGELDTTDAVTAAAAVMTLAPGRQPLIVDLEALEFIDCHAVSALLGVRRSARRAGGDVLLAAPHGLVLRVLTLIEVPEVHASVAAAAGSVSAPLPGLLAGSQQLALRYPVPMMAVRLAVWRCRVMVARRAISRPSRWVRG